MICRLWQVVQEQVARVRVVQAPAGQVQVVPGLVVQVRVALAPVGQVQEVQEVQAEAMRVGPVQPC